MRPTNEPLAVIPFYRQFASAIASVIRTPGLSSSFPDTSHWESVSTVYKFKFTDLLGFLWASSNATSQSVNASTVSTSAVPFFRKFRRKSYDDKSD